MASLISKLFKKPENLKDIFDRGAIILDVRSPQEFDSGHVAGAVNIPLNQLNLQIPNLKKKGKPVITCCKSGGRSAMAKATLSAAGIEVYNGGPWDSLQNQIR
jgi:rhodanese-related sulfurtransferase